MKFTFRKRAKNGFTLVEVVLVMVILAILLSLLMPILTTSFGNYFSARNLNTEQSELYFAINYMSSELRRIASPASLTTATSTAITFTDYNSQVIAYSISSGQLVRTSNGGTARALLNNVQSLSLQYFDSAGATTATPANVRLIGITLTTVFPRENNATYTYRTVVFPRY